MNTVRIVEFDNARYQREVVNPGSMDDYKARKKFDDAIRFFEQQVNDEIEQERAEGFECLSVRYSEALTHGTTGVWRAFLEFK